MAVAVERIPNMVLDADYRIVEVGRVAEAGFGPQRGQELWDAFPGAKPLFQPYYDQAWRTGEPVEFVQYYGGYITRIQAIAVDRRLHLFWEVLWCIDTLTLEGLRTSLHEALGLIEECEDRIGRGRVRSLLSVVQGERR